MEYTTRLFGKIDVDEEKIIDFPNGILGFPDLKRFTLMFDKDDGDSRGMNFLVSLDEPAFVMPVVVAILVRPGYSPIFTEDVQAVVGELTEENALCLVTMTIPSNITAMSVNLNAPIIINSETRKGVQSIVENKDYEIKYPIYEYLKSNGAE